MQQMRRFREKGWKIATFLLMVLFKAIGLALCTLQKNMKTNGKCGQVIG
jgi:hypothetical protein